MTRPVFRPRVEGLEDRLAPATFTVTTVNNAGSGSLRAAINSANAASGPDTIDFNIAGTGVKRINLLSALPTISDTVTLDGTTQPGFTATPVIVLNGASAGAANGLVIAGANANDCTIKGLVVQRFAGNGIVLLSLSNTVETCFIGTNPAGTAMASNGGSGIAILDGSIKNTIGGAASARNLISGNGQHGVLLQGAGVALNHVSGDFIGSNLAGTLALPNRLDGVAIKQGAHGNTIGDPTLVTFIAGNNRHGINISGLGTDGNTVEFTSSGSNLGNGIQIAAGASNNTIGGATADLANVLAANSLNGVFITGARTAGNIIEGNFIGTADNGTTPVGNGLDGVQIAGGAHDNSIGGSATGAGNVISANGRFGINITAASRNQVAGNLIGLTGDGTTALGNRGNGVTIAAGSADNTIGGSTAGERNVISGNGGSGLVVNGAGTARNAILGNSIGTNAAGTAAIANARDGVVVSGGASHNDIGVAGNGNIISGNVLNGIRLKGVGTIANTLAGNIIGLNGAGTAALANGASGVVIAPGATDNTIGGTNTGAGNTISGNTRFGVLVSASRTTIRGNAIGTRADGGGALGNHAHGIFVTASAADTFIGGTEPEAANTIANNGGDGVLIGSDPAAGFGTPAGNGNTILGNSIFGNALLGIDLGSKDGVTANDGADADGGPNRLQNFPVIDAATINTTQIAIDIELVSAPLTTYRIEFFQTLAADGSGFGEGATFLGFIDVTTDASGHATGTGNFPFSALNGLSITATATSLATNDTSEFSQAMTAT